MKVLVALLMLSAPTAALADATGAAADACRAYARHELTRDGATIEDVVIERDRDLALQRYGRSVGTQRVGAILSGKGAVVYPSTPGIELSFVCLLARDGRPVFFHWIPRRDASALTQCTRSEALRSAGPRSCLEGLLAVEERDLTQLYGARLQQARERDAAAGGERAYRVLSSSNKAWREYRDAECARRGASPAAGQDAADLVLACEVELTRLRAAEMRR
jgi:uncharacterized protein YecT (DUF1311 family)